VRRWTLFAVGWTILLAAASADAGPPLNLPIEEHVLGNGLRVLLAPDPSLDDVTVLVRYGVGSSDDPTGKDGLAHLTEHMMFDGSEHVPKGAYWRWLNRAGATSINGLTWLDMTTYFATVPPDALPLVFWLESDRMGFVASRIQPAALDHERELVREEIDGRFEDASLGGLPAVLSSEVFPPWHPYHRDYDPRWLSNLSVEDIRAFLRTWYVPQNAALIVAGRFDPQSVLSLAQKYFGDLPSHPSPERPALPSWQPRSVALEMRAPVSRDVVVVAWPAPAVGQPEDAALDLAATVLTDPQGRLQAELTRTGFVTQVNARESSAARASFFTVSATIADGKSAEEVLRSIRESVRRVGESVTEQECARARAEWTDLLLQRLETSNGRASRLVHARPGSPDPWDARKYDAIGPAAVAAAVRHTLGAPPVTIVVRRDLSAPKRGVVEGRREGTP
jgi:zinc protease